MVGEDGSLEREFTQLVPIRSVDLKGVPIPQDYVRSPLNAVDLNTDTRVLRSPAGFATIDELLNLIDRRPLTLWNFTARESPWQVLQKCPRWMYVLDHLLFCYRD